MTIKKLLTGASAFAVAVSLGSIASAQSIEEGPSVLARVLNNVNTVQGAAVGTTGLIIGNSIAAANGGSQVDSALINLAATSLSLFDNDNDPTTVGDRATGDLDNVLGNINASVTVSFTDNAATGLLSETVTPILDSTGDAVIESTGGVVQAVVSNTFQELTGTLGDITTLSLGASLDATASIAAGVNQDVSEALASNTTFGVNQRVDLPELLALNGAVNSASLNSSVGLTVADYSLDASAISTTAIGAVGGGSIDVGSTMTRLERSIAGVIGQ